MGLFEKYLSLWVSLSIILGALLGLGLPDLFLFLSTLEFANVNLPVAILIWVMIYPMMIQVDFGSIKEVGAKPQALVLTLVINWLIKPFSMAALGWLFFRVIFADLVDPQTATEYIAGMILLGVAPCTAMVFVWSQLVKGDANYTLVQVSVNDLIMIFAFAPITGLLLGMTDITVPWQTLILSVILYVLLPLGAGIFTRRLLVQKNSGALEAGTDLNQNPNEIDRFVAKLKPFSICGLLATVALLFGFQAHTILANPLAIVLIAIPLAIQGYGIFAISYGAAAKIGLPHNLAAPASLIGTSNFFELAVAVAISLFGLHSGAALATVVGVLIEVPVMLSLVRFANRTKGWFPNR